jgi:CTP:molybdopterin cytidylyltransferase MocA
LELAAVVLAAGAATRFGGPKQALLLHDVLRAVRDAGLDEIVVVAGAHDLETDARLVVCPDWELGPGASLRCGLAALPANVEAAVVVLADGPDLASGAIERVLAVWQDRGAAFVAASYGGVRGHPVVLARTEWADVPDEGLRAREPLLVPCDDLGDPGDIDRPDDLPERFRTSPGEPM